MFMLAFQKSRGSQRCNGCPSFQATEPNPGLGKMLQGTLSFAGRPRSHRAMGRDGHGKREERPHERSLQSKVHVAPEGVCLSVWDLGAVPLGLPVGAGASLWSG